MYNVYVLKSNANKSIYIGHTDNIKKRLIYHLRGYNLATKNFTDWELVHQEKYSTRSLAMKREKFLKSGDGRKVLKLKGII